MRLNVALIPPLAVQEDLADLVARVPGGREQLTPVPAHLLHLRLANFGNVALRDAEAVRKTLQREVAQLPRMKFRFHGGVALEPLGDDSGWAQLQGDLGPLIDAANLTVRLGKRLGFLVDRRLPRTLVRVGRITPVATEDYLQELIDRLDDYNGPEWECRELAVLDMSDSPEAGARTFEVMQRLQLKVEG